MSRDNAEGYPVKWADRVHFEFSNTAATGQEILMYSDGSGAVRALAATERLCVAELMATIDTAGSVQVFLDANDDNAADAGEIIAQGYYAANGGFVLRLPITGPEGAKPHVIITGGGNVRISGSGYILKASAA